MDNNFSAEDELICLCSRLVPGPDEVSRIKQFLSRALNWAYMVGQIKEQGVTTLFFHTLSNLGLSLEGIIPEAAISKMRNTYYLVAERNARNYQNLQELLLHLNQAGIEVILLKGLGLADLIYNNLALRQVADTDFLAKKEDFKRLKGFLLSYGYQQSYADSPWAESLENFGAEMYFQKEGFTFLDIHQSLCQYERFKGIIKIDQGSWQGRQKISLSGTPVSILSCEDMVLHLCLHLSLAHFFHKLSLFCDLRETVIHYKKTLNWVELVQKAEDYRMRHLAYQSLRLTEAFLGSFIGKDLLEKLKPNRMKVGLLNLALMNKSSSLNSLKDERRKYVFQLLSLDFLLDILKLIFKVFFPSAEWLRYRYAIRTLWKYYLYRLLHPCLVFRTFLLGRMELRF